MKSIRKSSAGFSLVELMVVVAIIGILATIAVPQVNKFMAKARQSEAKGNLSTLYSTEKAFFAEYTTYYTGFNVVGFSPEGDMRYNIGFSGEHRAFGLLDDDGYRGPQPGAIYHNSQAYCQAPANGSCTALNDAVGAPMTESALNDTAFTAVASSNSIGYNVNDRWTINNNKVLINTVSGIR